ncbi:hypothetical protein D0809_01375 [Flavobacterium circumlabens]|uniref:Carboxypeptidase regulatory-like domain-containing protein n=1 Tax=Flavobacterium circumlabens TaxID=2133765 RepID=A0A4Y7UGZ0_9FLAO|nr:hypothetical protein [Flavobacterium circumlabens]TCN60528.1 hypothetical protein EV142_10196 [Flavobacterium circumlabens]TEB45687.1 hypothetical protein D0809_01375 [Flavobacterium circumlabens]
MKINKFIVLMFSCFFFISGGSFAQKKLIPNNNKGGYNLVVSEEKLKNDDAHYVTIRGHVYDLKTEKPLSVAKLIVGCFEFMTTDQGEYSFKTRNQEDEFFYVEVFAFLYRPVETNYINIYNKKEVIIDFYLAEDDRPFLECSAIGGETHKRKQEELNNLK